MHISTANSPLWDKLAPKNFPHTDVSQAAYLQKHLQEANHNELRFDIQNGKHGGLYGFARDAKSAVRIA